MIYLIESNGYHKIGFTENEETLQKRLKSYRTHNPNFKLIGLIEGDINVEEQLHNEFSKQKKEDRTEWFSLGDMSTELIDRFSLMQNQLISKLFGLSVYETKEPVFGEIHTNVTYQIGADRYETILTGEGKVYVIKISAGESVRTFTGNANNISTFYYDYDSQGEFYSGFIVDRTIYSNFRTSKISISGNGLPYTGIVTTKDNTCFYNKIKPFEEALR